MGAPVHLLLVDDDEVDRERVRRLLGLPYTLQESATGQQALQLARTHRPDCILLDYRLPDIGGLELLPQFTLSYIPVIILTGEESPEVIVQAMRLGAQDYLVKGHLSQMGLVHAINSAMEKASMRRDIEQKNQQLRELASALTLAEQRERRRISQVLHDHVQQILYGIQMRAHLIALDSSGQDELCDQAHALEALTHDAIRITRTLTVELSPPMLHNEGLVAALRWLANHMADNYGLTVTIRAETDYESGSEDLQVLLFQLVRELLFNVVKHAGVKQAQVLLYEEDGRVLIEVVDHGCGFDPARLMHGGPDQAGFGLYSIRERLALFGGSLTIDTAPNAGVRARITTPTQSACASTPGKDA